MESINKTSSSSKPLATSIKTVTTIAFIGFVALAAGGPKLFNKGGIEETQADASPAAPTVVTPAAKASEAYYFPSGFEAPKGEVASIPDTF